MDVLADVLAAAGVRGAVAATLHAGGRWGLAVDSIDGAAFHAVTTGTAFLELDGRPPVRLVPGDVVLLPGGSAHGVVSDPGARRVPWTRAVAASAGPGIGFVQPGTPVPVGTPPVQTRILCAAYRQDPVVTTPVLRLMPEVVHIPADACAGLADAVRLLAGEVATPGLGSAVVLDRLVDVLIVMAVRAWLTTHDHPPVSWLGALGDPVCADALAALHADPSAGWTVASLAAHVGVSRATLARRFTAAVGEPPLAHLARWRLDLAARRLRDSDDSVAAIAASVGYASEFAFSRAFRRARAVPPTRFRQLARSAG